MAIPAKPTITAPPNDLPTRGENETNFSNKINNLVAWYPDLTNNLNDSIDWMDTVFTAVEGEVALAQQAVTDATAQANAASDSATAATNQADRAKSEADEAEGFKDGAEAAAAAAQASAGLPAITGKTGSVLTVIGGTGNETVSFEGAGFDGVTLTKTFSANEEYILVQSAPTTYAPIVSAAKEVPQASVSNNQWETAISDQSMTVQTGLQFGANGLEIDLTGGTYVGEYLAAVTSESTNTDYWTDINGMTPDDAANGEFISYALSDDGGSSFYIVLSGAGSRIVARDNGGSWEINNSPAFSSQEWIASPEGSMLGALSLSPEYALSGFELGSASYDDSLQVSPLVSNPTGVAVSRDGDKMMVCDFATASVYQYTLSSNNDVATATYDSILLDVSAQAPSPQDLFLTQDGTDLFIMDFGGTVYRYSLSSDNDLSTATYSGDSFGVGTQEGTPRAVSFSPGGDLMFVVGNGQATVFSYSLSSPYDLSTASYSGDSFSVGAQEGTPQGLAFSLDGKQMYIVGSGSDAAYQYDLSSPFDISTASYNSVSIDLSAQDTIPNGIGFSYNGAVMFISGTGADSVHQYSLGLSSVNIMPPSQLSAATDSDFPAVTSSLDLAVILRTADAGTTPTTNGVTIDYDGNVADEVAVNGTDYTAQKLSDTEIRFTAINAGNYKVRIL